MMRSGREQDAVTHNRAPEGAPACRPLSVDNDYRRYGRARLRLPLASFQQVEIETEYRIPPGRKERRKPISCQVPGVPRLFLPLV